MKNDPLVAKLYNKMQQEQNEYRAWLLAQPPEEILNHAYEYSSREDILMAFENVSLRPAQLRALLESQAPLADIYKDYAITIPMHWMLWPCASRTAPIST